MATHSRPMVIGHRGASGYRPEHSRAAYELAFALGVDAVEPDLVATRDGVLVIRHENEISCTTDITEHPEFSERRTTKDIDGVSHTGWFTEDFTWAELATLRVVERLPAVRQASATFDGRDGILRLVDLLALIDAQQRAIVLVAEIKHASYFASIGLPLDELFARAITGWATADNLIVESFEQSVLGRIRQLGVPGRYVFLAEASGSPPDLVAQHGSAALPYAAHLTEAGLARLASDRGADDRGADNRGADTLDGARVDGISVDKRTLISTDAAGRPIADASIVERAHAAGLTVFCWTLRAENRFLAPGFRRGKVARDFGDWRAEFGLLLGTGVDGVFADQPDLVVAMLEQDGQFGGSDARPRIDGQ